MTRILVAGDWHGNVEWSQKIVHVAVNNNCQNILQLGDFGYWSGPKGLKYRNELSQCLMDNYIKLYWLPGNHEDYNQIAEFPNRYTPTAKGFYQIDSNIFYVGKVNSWIWAGKRIAAVGGAVSIDRHLRILNESWWPQEQLTAREVEQAKQIGKTDYLFTHDCPQAHPFKYLVNDLESEIHRWTMTDIAKVLDPMLWFHGHMHRPAEYNFGPDCVVYGLDCDGSLMQDHVKILDLETGEVSSVIH